MQNRIQHCDCDMAMREEKYKILIKIVENVYRDFYGCKLQA